MTYHVEVLTPGQPRTDFTTRSRYYAEKRHLELSRRGFPVEVRTGDGRLVIDTAGNAK